jgi:hypothetical protein
LLTNLVRLADDGKQRAGRVVVAGSAAAAVAVACLVVASGLGKPEPISPAGIAAAVPSPPSRAEIRPEPVWPAEGAGDEARAIARARGGSVSFAAIGPRQREVTFDADRRYSAASVVKAMLLVAELRRLAREDLALDDETARTLRAMITYSDNDAADAIYARSGDEGMFDVARDAGMTRFTVAGHWGNAQITARDMASFMWRLDDLLDLPHGRYAGDLLASVIEPQRWGLPEVTPDDAYLRFKGGWVPTDDGQIVHQAGLVELEGRRYAVAVLTDAQPSMQHAIETIEAVEWQLLRTDPRPARASRGGSGS